MRGKAKEMTTQPKPDDASVRTCYLQLAVGLAVTKWPLILFGAANQPLLAGVVNALLGAIGLLAILGLFAPLRMLPLLVFEVTWKFIWKVPVALPLWLAHALTPETGASCSHSPLQCPSYSLSHGAMFLINTSEAWRHGNDGWQSQYHSVIPLLAKRKTTVGGVTCAMVWL